MAENSMQQKQQDSTSKDSPPQDKYLFEELQALDKKIKDTKGLPADLETRANQMLNRLNRMAQTGVYAAEFDTLSRYIEVITTIPWANYTEDNLDLQHASEMLEKNHYGMPGVKERILEYLATMVLLKQRDEEQMSRSPILLLVGLQGVGKTTLAYSVAEALDREFVRIALGAVGNVLEIRGRSKALPQAEPGQIIKALVRSQVMNPVILLDEIDKASGSAGLMSDIMAVLLEVLDPKQNVEFRDHYVDFPVNLSKVMFICSANNLGTLSAALLDRMEIIKMPSYTDDEKTVIAKHYLMPKVFKQAGLREGELVIEETLWPAIVRPFGYDTGIRSLERTLQAITRKVAKEIVDGKSQSVYINSANLKYYLPN